MSRRVLAVRLDSDGDVLMTGPAIRALAAGSDRLDLLVSTSGRQAAELLPGVDEVIVFDAPWVGFVPPSVDRAGLDKLVGELSSRDYDDAVIFTSFHQSPLPMALVARLAGIPRVAATSDDYPGSLLDVRHQRSAVGDRDRGGPEGGHEVCAALSLAEAAGFPLPPWDDRQLRVDLERELDGAVTAPLHLPALPEVVPGAPPGPLPGPLPDEYVVLHPRAAVPARSLTRQHAVAVANALADDGWHVVVTGTADTDFEHAAPDLDARGLGLAGHGQAAIIDLVGRTSYRQLGRVLAGAACVVATNTGPAHLAAAVGTPVVSLFAPVVPAARWRPWGVPTVLLGDQNAACRGLRSRECPVPGHPCLTSIDPLSVQLAVRELAGGVPQTMKEPA